MEYELNAQNSLILKKIVLLFRHISADLQIIASENGLNLYALNPSNSVWLHIRLGKGFFERIQFKNSDTPTSPCVSNVKHWFVSAKHLSQSLSIIIPPGQKSSAFKALLIKDLNNFEDLKNSSGLDRLIIREYQDNVDFLSLIFICSNKNIVRSATIGFQEYKLTIPEDLGWTNWHYLRISPSVFGKSISPFSSNYNDVSITYNDSREDLLLNVINNTSKLSLNTKHKRIISGKVLINSRHFHKLDLDDGLTYPAGITIAIKEFLSLVSFCESIKCPLSLVLKSPGDPVIALFGGSVDACESVTSNLNIHNVVYKGCNHDNDSSQDTLPSEKSYLSGSLWISSFQGETIVDVADEEHVEVPERQDIQQEKYKAEYNKSQHFQEERTRYSVDELDRMYKVLLDDFMADNIENECAKTDEGLNADDDFDTLLNSKELEKISNLW